MHYYNRYIPFNSVTLQADEASVSADKKTYTDPKYMVRNEQTALPAGRAHGADPPHSPSTLFTNTPTPPRYLMYRSPLLPAQAGTTRTMTSAAAST